MVDISKLPGARSTPTDGVKSKLATSRVGGKTDEAIPGLDLPTAATEAPVSDSKDAQKTLVQTLLGIKEQLTVSQLADILNVSVSSSTKAQLEQLHKTLLKSSLGPGGLVDADTATTVQKAISEVIKQGARADSATASSGSAGGGSQAEVASSRRYTQQSAHNAAAVVPPSEDSNNGEAGGNALLPPAPRGREAGDAHKSHRRSSKDPLGLQEPLSAKDKVQNYLERFDQDSQGAATGATDFKPFSKQQWK